jgi:chitodextrinase
MDKCDRANISSRLGVVDPLYGCKLYQNSVYAHTLGMTTGLRHRDDHTLMGYPACGSRGLDSCSLYSGQKSWLLANKGQWFPSLDIKAPTAPTALTAKAASSSRIDLTWQPSSDNVGIIGYNIYRNGTHIDTIEGDGSEESNYSVAGLSPSTTYSFTVKALDAADNLSPASNTASATTSSAAPSSSPSWHGPESLGGPTSNQATSAPAVASWGSGHLDVFTRGADNVLYHKYLLNGNWSGWESLGVGLTSDPAAVSWGYGRVDVFFKGLGDYLWHKSFSGSGWSGADQLGGPIGSGAGVSSWGVGRLDVFVKGANDNFMRHRYFDNGQWYPWEAFTDGQISGKPAAVSRTNNIIDIVARGTDGAVYHKAWNGSGWNGWDSLGGNVLYSPAISSQNSTNLSVWGVGSSPSGGLFGKTWNGSSWAGWTYANATAYAAPDAVSWGSDRIDVFYRGSDQQIHHLWYQ